jgi:hypothetical protein
MKFYFYSQIFLLKKIYKIYKDLIFFIHIIDIKLLYLIFLKLHIN